MLCISRNNKRFSESKCKVQQWKKNPWKISENVYYTATIPVTNTHNVLRTLINIALYELGFKLRLEKNIKKMCSLFWQIHRK